MNISRDPSEILELFFRDSLTCFVLLDRDFNFIRVNKAYAEVCARDISEFSGRNHFELYPSDAQKIFEEVRKKKEPYEVFARPFEFPDHPEWGTTYWDWRLEPILDDQGEVEMFIFSLNNVTDHALASQEVDKLKGELEDRVDELQESELQYRTLVETTPHGIQEIDASGNILFCNPAFCQMLGYSAEELSKMNVAEILPKEDRKRFAADIATLVAEEPAPTPYFNKNVTKGGHTIEVEVNWNYKHNEAGDVIGFISVITDITKRMETEAALKSSHDELEQRVAQRTSELVKAKEEAEMANLSKTKFLAAASHDLRQPLQAAHLFLDVLANKEHQPESREIISHLGASVGALDNLLDSLLDISRLEAGLIEPSMQTVAISPMMKRLSEEYSHIARDKGVAFKSVMTKAVVHTDPALVESILRNLLSNAIKHTGQGKVLFGCRNHKNSITIEVWDNGRGIPEDQLSEIFGEFVQISNEDQDRSKSLGLGLGLSIVEKLAGLLDHRINVRSWEGNGSAFTIELPLAHEGGPSDQSEEPSVTTPLTKASIFIVDDEPAIRTSLTLVLEQNGYEVHASNGLDCQKCKGIASKMTAPPDIIVADFRLENGRSGIDAIRCIREAFKDEIPAILLTGDTGPDRLAEAKLSKLPLLHKPVNADELIHAITSHIKAE